MTEAFASRLRARTDWRSALPDPPDSPEAGLRALPASPYTSAPAARLAAWVDDRSAELVGVATVVAINQTRLRLAQRVLAEYNATPVEARDIVRTGDGQLGILGVFIEALDRFHELEMGLAGPVFCEPAKPPKRKKDKAAPSPQPAGTWFAVVDDE